MKRLVHIHGGEVFDSYDAYFDHLKQIVLEDPWAEHLPKWKDMYEDMLGDDWAILRLRMPSALNAKYAEWSLWFEKHIPFLEDGVVIVGHSLGANFIAKFLAETKVPIRIAQLHLVAGCFGCKGGFSMPQDLTRILDQADKVVLYHSQDDEVVSIDDVHKYKEALPEAELVVLDGRGHFSDSNFPEIFSKINE